MQRVILVTVGGLKEEWAKLAASQYERRIRPSVSFDVVELPASKERDDRKQKKDESRRLLEHAQKYRGALLVLDESGKQRTSVQFSHDLEDMKDAGTNLIVILGGAYGLDDSVLEAADRILSLSDMTLPHELCRIVFMEQLYRACEITKGSGYHHI